MKNGTPPKGAKGPEEWRAAGPGLLVPVRHRLEGDKGSVGTDHDPAGIKRCAGHL